MSEDEEYIVEYLAGLVHQYDEDKVFVRWDGYPISQVTDEYTSNVMDNYEQELKIYRDRIKECKKRIKYYKANPGQKYRVEEDSSSDSSIPLEDIIIPSPTAPNTTPFHLRKNTVIRFHSYKIEIPAEPLHIFPFRVNLNE